MSGPMGHFNYASDDGGTYRVRADASNAAVAGGTATSSGPGLPAGFEMRYFLCQSAAGNRRKITCFDPTMTLWLGNSGVLALQEAGVAGTVDYTITGRFGEKRTGRG